MSFSYTNTWSNLLKVAGTSDARQVRKVLDFGNLIAPDEHPFVRLLGGSVMENGKKKKVSGMIASQVVETLTPEVFDYEVAPSDFRVTEDSVATGSGSTMVLKLDSTSGVQIDQVLHKVDQDLQARVVSIESTTQVTVKILYPGAVTSWLSDPSLKSIQKLGVSSADGQTIGNGSNREPTQRSNNLQFMTVPISQGFIQGKLELYANNGNDYQRELHQTMIDFTRMRESQFIAGRKLVEGTGLDRRFYADGLQGWAGSVFNNTNPAGELPWDDFARILLPAARTGGGGMDVMGLCGTDVATTLSSYAQKQKFVSEVTPSKYDCAITELLVPAGRLRLISSQFMNAGPRRGQMFTFQPSLLKRAFLKDVDVQIMAGMNLGNEFVDRSALAVCEALMVSNPDAICLHTNLLK